MAGNCRYLWADMHTWILLVLVLLEDKQWYVVIQGHTDQSFGGVWPHQAFSAGFCMSLVLSVSVTRTQIHVGVFYPSLKLFLLFSLQYWRIGCRALCVLGEHAVLFPLVEQWAEVDIGLAGGHGMTEVSFTIL